MGALSPQRRRRSIGRNAPPPHDGWRAPTCQARGSRGPSAGDSWRALGGRRPPRGSTLRPPL
eukprot:943639-Pyramimonas_sp.AAC.3